MESALVERHGAVSRDLRIAAGGVAQQRLVDLERNLEVIERQRRRGTADEDAGRAVVAVEGQAELVDPRQVQARHALEIEVGAHGDAVVSKLGPGVGDLDQLQRIETRRELLEGDELIEWRVDKIDEVDQRTHRVQLWSRWHALLQTSAGWRSRSSPVWSPMVLLRHVGSASVLYAYAAGLLVTVGLEGACRRIRTTSSATTAFPLPILRPAIALAVSSRRPNTGAADRRRHRRRSQRRGRDHAGSGWGDRHLADLRGSVLRSTRRARPGPAWLRGRAFRHDSALAGKPPRQPKCPRFPQASRRDLSIATALG